MLVSARVQDTRGATGDSAPRLALLSPEALAEHVRLFGRVYRAARRGGARDDGARAFAREPWLPPSQGWTGGAS